MRNGFLHKQRERKKAFWEAEKKKCQLIMQSSAARGQIVGFIKFSGRFIVI
jgi:hypothetical protein